MRLWHTTLWISLTGMGGGRARQQGVPEASATQELSFADRVNFTVLLCDLRGGRTEKDEVLPLEVQCHFRDSVK